MVDIKKVRNFCIIAHIDHGKSTLADRILEVTKAIAKRDMRDQILDSMDIERERGITIKSQAVRLNFTSKNGETYTFNLIDTPGHVDFNYEVSRSLAACEGAVLLVDASQGVEAQTIANFYLAFNSNLEIVPVINKIDLPGANIEESKRQMVKEFAVDEKDIVCISAKMGQGITDVLEKVIEKIPPPQDNRDKPLRALIFDSFYDSFRGAVMIVRVRDGVLRKGDALKLFSNGRECQVEECGSLLLGLYPKDELASGEVGYIVSGIKSIHDVKIGDTVLSAVNTATEPLPGYREVKQMVFAGMYPSLNEEYDMLKKALDKLHLNDAALTYEPESSVALGFGFRCGFLGLLHLEIIQERLERESGIDLVVTSPSVKLKMLTTKGEEKWVNNPADFPAASVIEKIYEPYVKAMIIVPKEFLGNIITLCIEKRGIQTSMNYIDDKLVEINYELPLIEILYDFFDKLKSYSRGYASLDYELLDYREGEIVKIDILVAGDPVDALSVIAHKSNSVMRGRQIIEKLRKLIPKQMFQIALQAGISGNIIARENIAPLRKNVIAKCYGGDITRKRKLLEKQKEGKKRMKSIGNVDIPQEAFISILNVDDDVEEE
ncbi:MAG: elongation factor 4 [Spirochaetes bacterium]|nr:elongation factor 4 [Spirochaetota bacterium]